jgi:hypothetical protein
MSDVGGQNIIAFNKTTPYFVGCALMRAVTVRAKSLIAIMTKYSIFRRIIVFYNISPNSFTSLYGAFFVSVSVYMVNCQKLKAVFSAT